jgi:hypothetical protein
VIDDKTVTYILSAQKYFEDLKQLAAQLAGMLVLEAVGSKLAIVDPAEELYKDAADGLRGTRPTAQAGRHHDLLLAALAQLGEALSAAKAKRDPLPPLQAAYADLKSAAGALPGFEMVSFEQCCCHQKE